MPNYLPILLDCEGRRCVAIGGGVTAERRIRSLLDAGAIITMISPDVTEGLAILAEKGRLIWLKRHYAPGDTRGAFLVYAATDDASVNEQIAQEARERGILVNVASRSEAGTFITPGVLRRGRLTVAVSTSGSGPGAAIRVKRQLEELLGQEYEPYLDFLHSMREEIKQREANADIRRRLLRRLEGLDVLNEIREGTFKEWGPEVIEAWIADNRED